MNKIWMWVVVIIVIGIGGVWYYESSNMAAPANVSGDQAAVTNFGSYAYECDEHVTFTMTPATDMSTIALAPSAGATYPSAVTLSKVTATSGVQYQGGGYTFTGNGESVTLTSNGSTLNCSPVADPNNAPFNWGD